MHLDDANVEQSAVNPVERLLLCHCRVARHPPDETADPDAAENPAHDEHQWRLAMPPLTLEQVNGSAEHAPTDSAKPGADNPLVVMLLQQVSKPCCGVGYSVARDSAWS